MKEGASRGATATINRGPSLGAPRGGGERLAISLSIRSTGARQERMFAFSGPKASERNTPVINISGLTQRGKTYIARQNVSRTEMSAMFPARRGASADKGPRQSLSIESRTVAPLNGMRTTEKPATPRTEKAQVVGRTEVKRAEVKGAEVVYQRQVAVGAAPALTTEALRRRLGIVQEQDQTHAAVTERTGGVTIPQIERGVSAPATTPLETPVQRQARSERLVQVRAALAAHARDKAPVVTAKLEQQAVELAKPAPAPTDKPEASVATQSPVTTEARTWKERAAKRAEKKRSKKVPYAVDDGVQDRREELVNIGIAIVTDRGRLKEITGQEVEAAMPDDRSAISGILRLIGVSKNAEDGSLKAVRESIRSLGRLTKGQLLKAAKDAIATFPAVLKGNGSREVSRKEVELVVGTVEPIPVAV